MNPNTLSPEVVRIIHTCLTLESPKTPRTFTGADLLTATSIFSKLGECYDQEPTENPNLVMMMFKEVSDTLTTNEKALLLRLIDSMAWTVQDGKSVVAAKEALA